MIFFAFHRIIFHVVFIRVFSVFSIILHTQQQPASFADELDLKKSGARMKTFRKSHDQQKESQHEANT
jgi:preprotein translocase subunit SecY